MKNQNIRRAGYMSCIPSAGLPKPNGSKGYIPKTPFRMTRTELRKRLCEDGPDGCTEQCVNWDVCMYGHAWVEGK